MEILEYLHPELCMAGVEAEDRESLIRMVAGLMERQGFVKDSYGNAVWERECAYPTGIWNQGKNFAVAHTDACHVKRPAIAAVTLKTPVSFQRMDEPDQSVDIQVLFMLAVMEPEKQVFALKELFSLIQDEGFYTRLRGCADGAEIYQLFQHQKGDR